MSVIFRGNLSPFVAMRTITSHRWREMTKNHLFFVDCVFHRRYCPPRQGGTSPRRMKHMRSDFSVAVCHKTAHCLHETYKCTTRRRCRPNNRYHIAAQLWRLYRSAFRRPMPLSDEDDSGPSFNHLIGDVDAVGEPNGVGG